MASARIIYDASSATGGVHLANAIRAAVTAQQEMALAMAIVNQVTVGLSAPANLDGSVEFNTAAGVGAALLPALVSTQTAINTLSQALIGQLYAG